MYTCVCACVGLSDVILWIPAPLAASPTKPAGVWGGRQVVGRDGGAGVHRSNKKVCTHTVLYTSVQICSHTYGCIGAYSCTVGLHAKIYPVRR